MKKYISILFAAIFLLGCSADDFLDVIPTGTKIPTTVEDFDKLLNNPDLSYSVWVNAGMMDPDVYLTDALFNALSLSTQKEAYMWNGEMFTEDMADSDYEYRYRGIYVFNHILSYIDDAPLGGASTETDRKRIKGEALAQRAFEYFFLVNEYGPHYSAANLNVPAVPMPLVNNLSAQLSRSTVGEIYAQIEKDLSEAEALLEESKPINSKSNFRPGKASLKGFRALVSLFKGEFQAAADNADQALQLYNFVYNYTAMGNVTPGDAWSGLNTTELTYSFDNQSVIWNRRHTTYYVNPVQLYHPDFLALFDQDNDQRFRLFSSQRTYIGSVDVSPYFAYANSNAETVSGITGADLYLISAEAHIRSGNAAAALQSLNALLAKRILNFVPYQTADFGNNGEILQLVKNERRKELMATSKNWFDLKRYQAYGESVGTFTRTVAGKTVTLEPGSSTYVLPISLKIRNLNPNL